MNIKKISTILAFLAFFAMSSAGAAGYESECNIRSGIGNFLEKAEAGEDVTVAFIGGSITQADSGYRLQLCNHMEKLWPQAKFRWINAGIPGTGTDLGAFRIDDQVLKYKPDLTFIEFAVNYGYAPGLEGMVRKIIRSGDRQDICLLYAVTAKQQKAYRKGGMPETIKKMEEVAEYYDIPSIHMGMNQVILQEDGIHPTPEGGSLYAAAIRRGLEKIAAAKIPGSRHSLPEPVFGTAWESACMFSPEDIAEFDYTWKRIRTADVPELKKFSGWFDTVMSSGKPESYFSFGFEGDMIGFFDIGCPEAGQLEIAIDGKLVRLEESDEEGFLHYIANEREGEYVLNRFNRWCNNRSRGQYAVISMENGVHQITVRISGVKADKAAILGSNAKTDISSNPQKYDRSVIYLGKILLRGRPVRCERVKGVPKLAQQLKWDSKMERYERQDELDPPKDGNILFVGSSTIENWKTVSDDFRGKDVINRGVSGTKTIDIINYFDRLIGPYDPRQIFIYVGDNDIGYSWSPEEIEGQMKRLFFMTRENKPDAEIYVISIKPSPRRLAARERIEQANALIENFVRTQPDAGYIDIYSAMLDENGNIIPEYYREDGLHLTAEGYEVWKKIISDYLK